MAAAPPFKVKAVYDYTSEHDDDLNFSIGQIINVTELEGDDWYVGEYTDAQGSPQQGLFPTNFVERYEPAVPTRPTRPAKTKQEPVAAQVEDRSVVDEAPRQSVDSKPQPYPVESNAIPDDEEKDITSRAPPAPKPAAAEPAGTPAKAPPPVAPKSNAFKDRIAAFNKVEQPLKPIVPGGKPQSSTFVKKSFVAPPSSSSYVPTIPKQEPIHRPYHREEDPEIKQRQEEDRAAAEAAGLVADTSKNDDEEAEDVPKPMSLKERMAMLQEQQKLQAERNAEAAQRKEKKAAAKKDHAPVPGGDVEEGEVVWTSESSERQSRETPRERPRVPSAHRRPQEPLSPGPPVPQHEIISGGEEADQSAAGETTEDDAETIGPGDDEREEPKPARAKAPAAPAREPDVGDEEDSTEDGENDDVEEELDEEELRKQRLRERMARLAGPQGGAGMPFNPFGAAVPSPARKKSSTREKKSEDDALPSSPPAPPQRVPIMPMPGMQRVQSPEVELSQKEFEDVYSTEDAPRRSFTGGDRGGAPPVPSGRPTVPLRSGERSVPPPPSTGENTRPVPPPPTQGENRPVPPPPPAVAALSPGPGSESDDEMSTHARRSSIDTSGVQTPLPIRSAGGPPSVPASEDKHSSYFNEAHNPTSDRPANRPVPPIPGSGPMSPRPPPPPPPAAAGVSRQSTDMAQPGKDADDRGESEYEGDYDTDIASSAKHKDALKAHAREPSLDDSTTADDTPERTSSIPSASAPRAVPPPPPSQTHPGTRQSSEHPRAPPPMPPTRAPAPDDDDYDPFRYQEANRPVPPVPGAAPAAVPPPPPPREPAVPEAEDSSADDMDFAPAPARPSNDRAPPPPPPHAAPIEPVAPLPPTSPPVEYAPRQSLNIQRNSTTMRRSMEQSRPSGEIGQMAGDIDLGEGAQWWTSQQPLPPNLQSRNGIDILSESEESTTSKRGGRTQISKDVYVLYMDYSQTIITARFDSRDPSDATLEQRHEPVPPKLRQDQLEAYWQRFGSKIVDAARQLGHGKKDTVAGDGSPHSLPLALIKANQDALLPVGTRAYGGLVYANLANASTQQFDEIRPGDIITLRNAKFEGSHGAIKQKYKQDYGPSHVAVVDEWDGTKRSVKAWEQGREKKGGVRLEKFRLGDLRSGEVRVWRVVGRDWVGWSD